MKKEKKEKLEIKKNELIQQVNNLNDLIDLNNKDLVNKILELEKVIEVLNKELNLENNKKLILENKIIKLEKNINRQIDEVSEREEMSIKRETQKEFLENNNEIKLFNPNEEQNEKIDNYKTQISELKNENYSLIKTVNNLKNEIKEDKDIKDIKEEIKNKNEEIKDKKIEKKINKGNFMFGEEKKSDIKIDENIGLPNEEFPSNHLYLKAMFKIN